MACQVGMALMGLMVAVALWGLRVRRVLPVPMARMVGTARMVRMGAR